MCRFSVFTDQSHRNSNLFEFSCGELQPITNRPDRPELRETWFIRLILLLIESGDLVSGGQPAQSFSHL